MSKALRLALLSGLILGGTGGWVGARPPVDLAAVHVNEPLYSLSVDKSTLRMTISSADGATYTSMPLTALVSAAEIPLAARSVVTSAGPDVTVRFVDADGERLGTAVVHATPTFFTVDFAVAPGPNSARIPQFFYDGHHGIDLSAITAGYSPDPGIAQHSRFPQLLTDVWTPLAPPPLDLEMDTSAGWFGVGLAQVPDATDMVVGGDGAISINYPLSVLRLFADRGAGGLDPSGDIHFPTFVFSFSGNPMSGLRAYRDAVVATGNAPSGPTPGPAWWRQPIADTWGEQVAEGALRGSPRFTTAWVRRFADDWRARSGLSAFTLVIDSRWQAELGSAEPDPQRFGDWAGMRQLIDSLHAQGLKVVLWWPMWGRAAALAQNNYKQPGHQARADVREPLLVVDPTAPGFEAQVRANLTRMLGSGPGDLDADGLKLDWGYNIPLTVSHPELGWGDAALYHYLDVLHTDGHAIKPDAYIESSAPSPQFLRVADGIRLYDAWSDSTWEQRARIVTETDPGAIIDGDDWQATAADDLVHEVTSSVFGVPASYFSTNWPNHVAIAPTFDRLVGTLMDLSVVKGAGTATMLPTGEWCYASASMVRAETLANRTGMVVWDVPQRAGQLHGEVVVGRNETVAIPLPSSRSAQVTVSDGRTVFQHRVNGVIVVALQAGIVYTISGTMSPLAHPGTVC